MKLNVQKNYTLKKFILGTTTFFFNDILNSTLNIFNKNITKQFIQKQNHTNTKRRAVLIYI